MCYQPGLDWVGKQWDIAVDFRVDAETRQVIHHCPAHLRFSLKLESEHIEAYGPHHLTAPGVLPVKEGVGRSHNQHIAEQLYGLVDRIDRSFNAFFRASSDASNDRRVFRSEEIKTIHQDISSPAICIFHPGPTNDVEYWSSDGYVDLARRLHQHHAMQICIVGRGSEVPHNTWLAERMKQEGVDCIAESDLSDEDLLNCISTAGFLVGCNGDVKNIACLRGLPGVIINGGRHTPAVWGAPAPFMLNLYSPVICSPCQRVERNSCNNQMLCQSNITPEHVWRAATMLLSGIAWHSMAGRSSRVFASGASGPSELRPAVAYKDNGLRMISTR